jgi:hypothetical protein
MKQLPRDVSLPSIRQDELAHAAKQPLIKPVLALKTNISCQQEAHYTRREMSTESEYVRISSAIVSVYSPLSIK